MTAVVVSELAARSRRRATESELLAGIATSLLARGEVRGELERIASEVARVLQVDRARIELGDGTPDGEGAYPLVAGTRRVGVIHLDGPAPRGTAARRRLIPALASLLGVAVDRERLAAEALEAEALRRTDAMKTALLRAVSHDLRSPLMAILTRRRPWPATISNSTPKTAASCWRPSCRGRPPRPPRRQPPRPVAASGGRRAPGGRCLDGRRSGRTRAARAGDADEARIDVSLPSNHRQSGPTSTRSSACSSTSWRTPSSTRRRTNEWQST